MSPFQKSVGTALRLLREACGLTGVELARRCGIESQTLAGHESSRQGIQSDTLGRVLDALGANLCDLHTAMLAVQAQGEKAKIELKIDGEPAERSLIGDHAALRLALQLMRERQGLDVPTLANRIGVRTATAYTWESGRPLRMSTIERLLDTYGLALPDLHANLVVACFVRMWKANETDEQQQFRTALLCLGQPHPGSNLEQAGFDHLRSAQHRIEAESPVEAS